MSISAASKDFLCQRERLSKVTNDELAGMLAKAITSRNVTYFEELMNFIDKKQKDKPIEMKEELDDSNNTSNSSPEKQKKFQQFMKQISPKNVFNKQKVGSSQAIDIDYIVNHFRYTHKTEIDFGNKQVFTVSLLNLAVRYGQNKIAQILLEHNVCFLFHILYGLGILEDQNL